jgi:hypothetical protein
MTEPVPGQDLPTTDPQVNRGCPPRERTAVKGARLLFAQRSSARARPGRAGDGGSISGCRLSQEAVGRPYSGSVRVRTGSRARTDLQPPRKGSLQPRLPRLVLSARPNRHCLHPVTQGRRPHRAHRLGQGAHLHSRVRRWRRRYPESHHAGQEQPLIVHPKAARLIHQALSFASRFARPSRRPTLRLELVP